MNLDNEFGPLPKASRSHELEKISLTALNNILPVELFRLRDERIDDTGVDVSLELMYKRLYTNMRAQVQIKSTDKFEPNQDGSVSFPAETSNINYLLNGNSPIYILYIHDVKQLRYTWIRDEVSRLSNDNPNWRQQGTNTVYLRNILTSDDLGEIYNRIKQESQLSRSIYEALGRSTLQEKVTIQIDNDTLSVISPEFIHTTLLSSGLTIVTSGYADDVLQSIEFLNAQQKQSPQIQLIRGYAEYTLGQYHAAFSSVAKANLQISELSEYNQQFLSYLKDICSFQIGRINIEEYIARKRNLIDDVNNPFRLEAKLEYLRQEMLETNDIFQSKNITNEIETLVAEITSTNSNTSTILQARLIALYAKGKFIIEQYITTSTWQEIRASVDLSVDDQVVWDFLNNSISWNREIGNVIELAKEAKHPLLLAEALATFLKIQTAFMSVIFLKQRELIDEAKLTPSKILESFGYSAVQIFQKSNQLEGELRVRLMLADLYMIIDQRSDAENLAREVLPKANAMDYDNLQKWATEILEKKSPWDNILKVMNEIETGDRDISWSQRSDDEMRRAALEWIRATQLPLDRLPNIERGWIAERDIAREKVEWCQHIELIENLRHLQSKDTMYVRDPKKFCRCAKHLYESYIGHEDWKGVIQAFKEARCKTCADRSPKKLNE